MKTLKHLKNVAKSVVRGVNKSLRGRPEHRSKHRSNRSSTRSLSESKKRNLSALIRNRMTPNPLRNIEKGPYRMTPNKSPNKSIPDVQYDLPLVDYDLEAEPEFWKPFFKEGEMLELRLKIQNMIIHDVDSRDGWKRNWKVCQLIKRIIKPYHVPSEMKVGPQPNGAFGVPHEPYFVIYNVFLCAILVIFGVISNKMKGHDYSFALKGGKAIQFLLETTPDAPEYESEDIDVLVLPHKKYNPEEIKNVAGHLANLLKWFIEIQKLGPTLSIQSPDRPRANPFIYKMSFAAMYKRIAYKAMMDIDFKEIPEEIEYVYKDPYSKTFNIKPLKEEVTFLCPNIDALLDEKVFYYVKYFKYLKRIEAGEEVSEVYKGVKQIITRAECGRMMEKFDKAIRVLKRGLEKKRGDNSFEAIQSAMLRRLNKRPLDLTDAEKHEIIDRIFR
jgi:hypothetical protein